MPYGQVIFSLHVPLRLLQLVDLRKAVALYSYKHPFQLVIFFLLLLLVIS